MPDMSNLKEKTYIEEWCRRERSDRGPEGELHCRGSGFEGWHK